jgi:hypothetical protein
MDRWVFCFTIFSILAVWDIILEGRLNMSIETFLKGLGIVPDEKSIKLTLDFSLRVARAERKRCIDYVKKAKKKFAILKHNDFPQDIEMAAEAIEEGLAL